MFQALVELTEAIHWEMDLLTQKFTYVSPQITNILGYSPSKWETFEDWADTLHPEDRDYAVSYCMTRTQQLADHKFIYRAISSEGRVVWLQDVVKVIEQDGKPVRLIGVIHDISEHKQAVMEISSSEEKFRELVEYLPEIVFEVDIDGDFVFINHYGFIATGYTFADIDKGFNYLGTIAPAERMRAARIFRISLKRSNIDGAEFKMRRKDGSSFYGIIRTDRIIREGAVVGLRGVIMDITPLKVAQDDLNESLREKSMLMREVHHRIKNNLSVIQSLLSLQSLDMSDERSREMFIDAGNRVMSMSIIHEMLHGSEDIRQMNTVEYIRTLVDALFNNYNVSRQKINMACQVEDIVLDVDTVIPLGLIINELVSNALKYAFMDGNNGTLTIGLKATGDNSYELLVKDSGPGLSDKFDIDTAQTLGMVIIKSLVGQIDGTLEIKSNGGASFRIAFSENPIA